MPIQASEQCAATVDGKIYVFGASNSSPNNNRVYEYDPATYVWTRKADMPTGRGQAACAALDGKVYVAGGNNCFSNCWLKTFECYDTATDSWTVLPPLPAEFGRGYLSAASVGGRIYVMGGVNSYEVPTFSDNFIYDPLTGSWTTGTPLPTPRSDHGAAVIDGEIYLVGGSYRYNHAGPVYFNAAVDVYDPAADSWRTVAPLPTVREGPAVAVLHGRIYAVGGITEHGVGTPTSIVEEYDPRDDYWRTVTSLPTAHSASAIAAVGGELFLVGGQDVISPGMALIPAGQFLMGNAFAGDGDSDELPRHAVYVDAFFIDVYEVTNADYAAALNWARNQGNQITVTNGVVYKYDSGTSYSYCDTNSSDSDSCILWNGTTFTVEAGRDNHPVVNVSWYGAVAYCNWRSAMAGQPQCYNLSTWACNFDVAGFRLPTEAEWEKAARGGAVGWRFPWADQDTIQHARCNYDSSSTYTYDTSPTPGQHPLWGVGGEPHTSPIGFFDGSPRYKADWNWPGLPTSYQTANGANGYGLFDMAGNVWEWCNDWYGASYYEDYVNQGSPPNPRGPSSGSHHLLRGGGWGSLAVNCRVAYRHSPYVAPNYRYMTVGFRCSLGALPGGGSVLAGIPRPTHGDLNNDGSCDFRDIDPFVGALGGCQ